MIDFLIMGYPRSRTTWLANLFNTDQVFCGHDSVCHFNSWDDYEQWLLSLRQYKNIIGECVSGAIFWDIKKALNPQRILIVTRNKEEVRESLSIMLEGSSHRESLLKLIDSKETFNIMDYIFEQLEKEKNVKRVDFSELNDVNILTEIWNHLLPSTSVDLVRIYNMMQYNVQENNIHERLNLALANNTTFLQSLIDTGILTKEYMEKCIKATGVSDITASDQNEGRMNHTTNTNEDLE